MENPTFTVIVPLKKKIGQMLKLGYEMLKCPDDQQDIFLFNSFQSVKTHLVERIVFCIQDEWWKCNAPSVHDTCGAAFGGLSDGYANEVGSRELGLCQEHLILPWKPTWLAGKSPVLVA